jgi:N-acetylmuramic acid 6-phosphate (MurNAc-6-P) etherase
VLLFPNGFPQVLALLDNTEQFLLTVLDGLRGVADAIVAFIEALQARITQLQALLEQIRALLDIVATLRLGSVSVLVTVEAGTSGTLRALLQAENPPVDTAADYGFGFSLVVGGAPTVAVDLLSAIFTAA